MTPPYSSYKRYGLCKKKEKEKEKEKEKKKKKRKRKKIYAKEHVGKIKEKRASFEELSFLFKNIKTSEKKVK
jgi:hypothetical protein